MTTAEQSPSASSHQMPTGASSAGFANGSQRARPGGRRRRGAAARDASGRRLRMRPPVAPV